MPTCLFLTRNFINLALNYHLLSLVLLTRNTLAFILGCPISPILWRDSFATYKSLGGHNYLQDLKYIFPLIFGLYSFCGKNEMLSYWWSLYMTSYYSLDALNILSFALAFDSFIKICLTVSLFGFIFLGVCLAFWIYRFMYFAKFWKFSVILISNTYSFPISLLGLYKVDVSTIDWVPWVL